MANLWDDFDQVRRKPQAGGGLWDEFDGVPQGPTAAPLDAGEFAAALDAVGLGGVQPPQNLALQAAIPVAPTVGDRFDAATGTTAPIVNPAAAARAAASPDYSRGLAEHLAGQYDAPMVGEMTARPDRTWGEALGEVGAAYRQGARGAVIGTLDAPRLAINAINTGGNLAAEALAGVFGQEIPPEQMIAMLERPELLQQLAAATDEIHARETAATVSGQTMFDEANRPDDFVGMLEYSLRNPSSLANDAARTAGAMTPAIVPGSGGATIGLQATQQAAMAAEDVERSLLARGVDPQTAQAEAAKAFTAASGVGLIAPNALRGGRAVEDLLAGRLGAGAGAAVGRVATPLAGEAGSEMLEEGGIQALTNLYSGDPVMQGTGGAAAMGGLLGLGMGAGPAAVEGARAYQDSRRSNAIPEDVLAGLRAALQSEPLVDTEPEAAPRQAAPEPPKSQDEAIAPEDTDDLEAMLVRNLVGAESEGDPAERIRSVFGGEAPTELDTARLPPLDEQRAAPPQGDAAAATGPQGEVADLAGQAGFTTRGPGGRRSMVVTDPDGTPRVVDRATGNGIPAPPSDAASHADPGEPPEAATQAVVSEAVRESADNTPRDLTQARQHLLGKIDAAMESASDAVVEGGNARDRAASAERIGYVTFDVPGDGKFRVVNSREQLSDFRTKVEKSQGFREKAPARRGPRLNTSMPAARRAEIMAEAETVQEGGERTVTIPYRDGDRQVQAREVDGELVFRNGDAWDVLRPAEGGTYRPRMIRGESPEDAVARAGREDANAAEVRRRADAARNGTRADQVLHALENHPEQALGMLTDDEVLQVAKALGRRRGRNQTVAALRERLSEGPRRDTIATLRPAIAQVVGAEALESTEPVTGTPEFQRWSRGAPVVPAERAMRHRFETGQPVVAEGFHGSPDARWAREHGIFQGSNERFGMPSDGSDRAFWFASDRGMARSYADDTRAWDYQSAEPAVLHYYVRLDNPLVIDGGGQEWRQAQQRGRTSDVIEQAREGGHDGVVIRNVRDNYQDNTRARPAVTYVVFDPRQIKSATDNSGAFDPDNPSSLEAVEQSRRDGEDEADLYGLREAVDAAVGEGRVTYLHGVEGLPERLRDYVKRQLEQRGGLGRTAALYDPRTKQVFLFTDVVTSPEGAVWNALHEIAGHHGLREFLGDRLAPALELALQNPTVKAVADAIARERDIDTRTRSGRLLAAEEALAELAAAVRTGDFDHITSRYGVPVPEGIRARLERAIENFLRRLKAALDDLVGRPVFTDEDVRGLLEAAWQSALVNGPTMAVQKADGSTVSEQVVFHGTPHTVDRFSLQKIGTGEGAQAYGWGLYFAGRREVAEHYRDNVIDVSWLDERNARGVELQRASESGDPAAVAAYEAHQNETARMAEEAQSRRGNLYRVDVPEDSDLLDWDAPLSQQPEKVREALAAMDPDSYHPDGEDYDASETGQQIYHRLLNDARDYAITRGDNTSTTLQQSAAKASRDLLAFGIPGLRYLDGGSRADGDGSRNYVIWDEAAIGEPQDADSIAGMEQAGADQTSTPAFRNWFGDSKVVDDKGQPLVVYHGTAADMDAFSTLALGASTKARSARGAFFFAASPTVASGYAMLSESRPALRNAIYKNAAESEVLSDRMRSRLREAAEQVSERDLTDSAWIDEAGGGITGANVMPVFLSLQNPMVVDYRGEEYRELSFADAIERARAAGHDGVIFRGAEDSAHREYSEVTDIFAVFKPTQIKSATGNRGTFDPGSDSILESVEYTPEQQEMMRKAGVGADTRSTWRKARDWMAGRRPDVRSDELIQSTLDGYYGLKRAVASRGGLPIDRDPYVAVRMVNIASTMEAILRFGAPKMQGGALRVNRDIPGLYDALKPVADNLPGFFGWMVARRAQVLKKQGRENLLTDADIAAGLSLAEGNEAAFNQAAKDYLRLKNAILDFAEQHGGTIDPVARAAWDHAEYIPFYRADEGGAAGPGTRKGLANQSSGIRALKGGDQALNDPLSNIVQNFTRLMDSALKNRAMLLAVDGLGAAFFEKLPMKVAPATIPLDQVKRHLLEQGVSQETLDAMPAATLKGAARMLSIQAPTGEDVVRVLRDGKPEYYRVLDPLVLRSVSAIHEHRFSDVTEKLVMAPLSWAKNLLTAGATATPDFLIRNTLRDTGEAAVTSRERFLPIVDTMRGATESLRENELAQDLMMAGSYFHGGLFHQGDHEATARATRRALRKHGLTDSQIERVVKGLVNPKRWWDVYRSGLEASEMGSRVSLARNRVKAGGSFLEGAFEAKDFLDFQLRGDAEVLQFFIRVIPFLNARLQGNYRLARAGTARDRRKVVLARMATMALATTALYAWNMLAYGDDYEELPDWEKDAYWHFAPGTSRHIRIPKPFELGLVAGTAVERGLAALVYQVSDGERGDERSKTWALLLRGVMDTLAINPIPQGVKPAAELWFNRNTFTGRPIESQADEFRSPSDRVTPRTSPTMIEVSRAMEAVAGEDALSPKQLEHLWRGYTGGMGMYLVSAADWVTRKLTDAPEPPEKALRDFPGIGAIYRGGGESYGSQGVDELYSLREQAKTQSDRIKTALESGEKGRAKRLEAEWGWLVGDRQGSKRAKAGFMHAGVRYLDGVGRDLSKLRKREAEVYGSRRLTPAQKREELDKIARERKKLARQAVNRVKERERRRTR